MFRYLVFKYPNYFHDVYYIPGNTSMYANFGLIDIIPLIKFPFSVPGQRTTGA